MAQSAIQRLFPRTLLNHGSLRRFRLPLLSGGSSQIQRGHGVLSTSERQPGKAWTDPRLPCRLTNTSARQHCNLIFILRCKGDNARASHLGRSFPAVLPDQLRAAPTVCCRRSVKCGYARYSHLLFSGLTVPS